MIFATVGTQHSFDRFVEILDSLASTIDEEIIVQNISGRYEPKHLKTVDFIEPDEYSRLFGEARLIVSHAGMGTIISALEQQKPIVIFERLGSLGEHRNEHQHFTAMKMNELGYVYAAYDRKQLEELLLKKDLKPLRTISPCADQELIEAVKQEIGSPLNHKRVLALASLGGHWIQLMRIVTLLDKDGYETVYASTNDNLRTIINGHRYYLIENFSRWDFYKLVPMFFRLLSIIVRERPSAVITTGAAPGIVALFVARMLRIKAVWIDSIANVRRLSLSGRIASFIASCTYTQWPELSKKKIKYAGCVFGR